jgi:hypothetical protein
MQAFYSFSSTVIGGVTGPVSVASIWDRWDLPWRPSRRGWFWRSLLSGEYLRGKARRKVTRGFRIAAWLALMGVLVGVSVRTMNLAVVATLGASFGRVEESSIFDMGPTITLEGWEGELDDWTVRPDDSQQWSAITMSDPQISESVYHGVVGQFVEDRPDLADIRELISEANDRVPAAVAMSLADMSEAIGASLRMGMSREEVAALIRLCSEFVFSLATATTTGDSSNGELNA